jgi:hypothetical protein
MCPCPSLPPSLPPSLLPSTSSLSFIPCSLCQYPVPTALENANPFPGLEFSSSRGGCRTLAKSRPSPHQAEHHFNAGTVWRWSEWSNTHSQLVSNVQNSHFLGHPGFRTLLLWQARCTLSGPACLYCFGKCRPERKNNCEVMPRRIPLPFCFYSVQNQLGIFALPERDSFGSLIIGEEIKKRRGGERLYA